MRPLAPFAGLLLVAPLACTDESGGAPLLAECMEDADCASGHCIDNVDRAATPSGGFGNSASFKFCSEPCDAECGSADADVDAVCGFGAEGDGWCVFACDRSQMATEELPGFECKAGVPVSCEGAQNADCMFCGCPEEAYCDLSARRCREKAQLQGECSEHVQCDTGFCDFASMRCGAPLGERCDGDGCADCAAGAGGDYCTHACTSDRSCPAGWRCVALFEEEEFFCRKQCQNADDACPSTDERCTEVTEVDNPYLACVK